jgi:endonuclease I
MRSVPRLSLRLLGALLLAPLALSGIPPGYYDTADDTNGATLRASLHAIIDDHVRFPYTSGGTDTWDILEIAQQDPNAAGAIIDVYHNMSFAKQGGGNAFYNREHAWPSSFGYPVDGTGNYPFTDCFQLFLADGTYNSARSNKPFRTCGGCTEEWVTVVNNGQGGGSGVYPGNSSWTSGFNQTGTWEAWNGRRGDLARALFYMDVRYEGGTHGVSGFAEPDLILTDSQALISASNTGSNESVAYMGILSVLLQWHQQDPVDDHERQRNETVHAFQGNRNPFIDHPEWVACIFSGNCTPAAPSFCDAFDGSLFWCPCGNQGSATTGCDIAQGTGGVRLELIAQSTTLTGATMRGSGFPTSSTPTAIVIRSPQQEPVANIFGDGVRCVSTVNLVRLAATVAFSGVSTHAFGPSAMAGPGDFHYQIWFRNTPASFCTPAAFNLSNGVQVTWP